MEFKPVKNGQVKMYVCGPTVYDFAHIGNARPVVVFDLFYRMFLQSYGEANVTYVRNFTDVDDKINERSKKLGIKIGELTNSTIEDYLFDMDSLGALRPNFMPRATNYIEHMIEMIKKLIESNNAYSDNGGHVMFSVRTFQDYGQLSRRTIEEMKAGARVEVAQNKRDPMDFVLWKPSTENQPGWESPWGRGRPGWHIECSAMSKELLGDTFDIHGGGIDLAFPHHENELAQSLCANPGKNFAKYWLHNGMLTVEGNKMSKSLGNFVTVRELLEDGISGDAIRLALISSHYRQPLDWTKKRLNECSDAIKRWKDLVLEKKETGIQSNEFLEAIYDDLNTPKAISVMHSLAKNGDYEGLLASLRFMGFLDTRNAENKSEIETEVKKLVETLIERRKKAKLDKNFELSDHLRDALSDAGVIIKDLKDGVVWEFSDEFNISKLKEI
tara:strand:- start:357 stop:1685 length:1329 start_codon:yes stop_codon:yes gene_type:complete